MRRAVPLLPFLLVLAACASAPGTGGVGGNPDVITSEQLRELDSEGLNVYQVVNRLKPQWLRSRGTTSIRGGADIPRAVVDNVPYGNVSDLNNVPARDALTVEFVSAGDATTRYGTGYAGGAVVVTTRR